MDGKQIQIANESFLRDVERHLEARIDPLVHSILNELSDTLGFPRSTILECLVLDFGARMVSSGELYGHLRDVFLPFIVNQREEPVTGQLLYGYLKRRWSRELLNSCEQEAQIAEMKTLEKELGQKVDA